MVLNVTDDQRIRLENLSHDTALIEERLKEAELICGNVVYPAVNELRYLARNLANILAISLSGSKNNGNNNKFERFLLDAELCCERANHDITDAIYMYISLEIEAVRKSMGASLIQGHFTEYSEQMKHLQSVNKLMAESRGSRRAERSEIYEDITNNYLPSLLEFYKELLTNKELLGEHFRAIQTNQKLVRFGSFFAFIASLASILSFFGVSASDLWPFGNSPTDDVEASK